MNTVADAGRETPEDLFCQASGFLRRFLRRMLFSLAGLFLVSPYTASATELTKPAIDAFQLYVQLTEARMEAELRSPASYLYFDSLPEKQRLLWQEQLAGGQVLVHRLETRQNGGKIHVPDGLVHHWIALVFMPDVRLTQALAVLQDYDRQQELYKPDVQRSRLLRRDEQNFKVFLRLYRKAIVTAVYNTEFDIQYFSMGETREHSRSYSTRIAEVEHPGKPEEREKPVGNDRGYLWRLYTYTRYEERDGGIYMQVEFIALSRSVPAIFAWLVNPYIKSIPREYLSHFLKVTRRELTGSKTP